MTEKLAGVVTRQRRGFATMDKEQQLKIARKGGVMAHLKGTAHTWTPEQARAAGKKGGAATRRTRTDMSDR
jgi:general stress protein YciG